MAAENVFNDLFGDWSVIQREFQMDTPEPEEVLYANYTSDDYTGDAVVLYRNGSSYYLAQGGHCSCYGLEGQWEPEEYPDRQTLLAALNKGWRPVPEWVRQKLADGR